MTKTDSFIKNRILWKAGKSKLPTESSFYFSDLSPTLQTYLQQYMEPDKSGLPVLFFTKTSKEWTLICTRQVICNNNQKIFSIQLNEIESLQPVHFDKSRPSRMPGFSEARKEEWHEVVVDDKTGNSHTLHADKGKDLFALWNVLIMVSRILGWWDNVGSSYNIRFGVLFSSIVGKKKFWTLSPKILINLVQELIGC